MNAGTENVNLKSDFFLGFLLQTSFWVFFHLFCCEASIWKVKLNPQSPAKGYFYVSITRLVSAYQDKIVDKTDPFFEPIIKDLKNNFGGVSFNNFSEMILKKGSLKYRNDPLLIRYVNK